MLRCKDCDVVVDPNALQWVTRNQINTEVVNLVGLANAKSKILWEKPVVNETKDVFQYYYKFFVVQSLVSLSGRWKIVVAWNYSFNIVRFVP